MKKKDDHKWFKLKSSSCIIIAIFAILFASAVAGEKRYFDWLDGYLEKRHYSTNDGIRHIRMNGIDFWIPKNYKFGSYDNSDLNQVAVVLQLLLPDFEPRTKENIKGFTEGLGWDNRMTILIDDSTKSTDLEYRYNKRIEMSQPHEKLSTEYGFSKVLRSKYPNGATVIGGAEFYIVRKNGALKTFIACDIGNRVKDQGCQHNFTYTNGLILNISYSSRYLPEWKEIETKSINLINTLRQKPEKISTSEKPSQFESSQPAKLTPGKHIHPQ